MLSASLNKPFPSFLAARAFDGLVGVPVSVERTTRDVSSGLTALTVIIVLEIAVVVVLFLVYNR